MPLSIPSLDHHHLRSVDGRPLLIAATYEDYFLLVDHGPLAITGLSVPSGTPVVVIDDAGTAKLVVLAAGPHRRQRGWVPSAWIASDTTTSQVA
jgi:hypothetical protein